MKSLTLACGALALALAALPLLASERPEPTTRLGVFDSRAVAIAYARSSRHDASLAEVRQRHAAARAAGDEATVREIDAEMRARQDRLHRQGFSTAPVDDILALVAAELPGLADKAGVDVLASTWSLAYRRPGAQVTDVTDRMVELFHPDAETREHLKQLGQHEPLPLYDTDWDGMKEH